jgi:hypothetical protein
MLLKTLKWPTLLALLPVYLLAEIVTWGFVLLKDRTHWTNKLRAYRSTMVNWRAIMRKRRATQRLRRVTDRELLRTMDFRLDFAQAADGWVAYLAGAIFTPAFFALRIAVRGLVWW